MGGGHALQIGLHHLDQFSAVAAFSSATPQGPLRGRDIKARRTEREAQVALDQCGRDDPAFGRWQRLDGVMNDHKVRHTFWATDGAHTFTGGRASLGELAPRLFTDLQVISAAHSPRFHRQSTSSFLTRLKRFNDRMARSVEVLGGYFVLFSLTNHSIPHAARATPAEMDPLIPHRDALGTHVLVSGWTGFTCSRCEHFFDINDS